MRKILLVIDLQKEFYLKGAYEKCMTYISDSDTDGKYDLIYATKCVNEPGSMFERTGVWTKGYEPEDLAFRPDIELWKAGYGLSPATIGDEAWKRLVSHKDVQYDIIGCNTGACVMAACFALFDAGVPFSVLTEYCYSTSGKEAHEAALMLLKNNFGKAVI